MVKQYIELGADGWHILIYYGVDEHDKNETAQVLAHLGCPKRDIVHSLNTLTRLNTGMTFSNLEERTSFVCIAKTTSAWQFVNTIVHEAKHVQSHVCKYYNIEEDGETAAYMIGHIVDRMYRRLRKVVKMYGRL